MNKLSIIAHLEEITSVKSHTQVERAVGSVLAERTAPIICAREYRFHESDSSRNRGTISRLFFRHFK